MNFVESYAADLNKLIISRSSQVEVILESLYSDYLDNRIFMIAGNGGNLANVLHMGTDWTKGLHYSCGAGMNLRVLGSNPSLLSAFENDLGHEYAIANLLILEKCDENTVVILFSAGGTSRNILEAAITARNLGSKVVGVMGGNNFSSHELFDLLLHYESADMQKVEDAHAIFGHMLLKYFEQKSKAV